MPKGKRSRSDHAVLNEFGRTLAARRHRLGVSQEELAHRSGLHRTYIGGLERGERNPTITTLVKLAEGLDCRVRDLVGRDFSW